MLLSVVIPVLNEAQAIPLLLIAFARRFTTSTGKSSLWMTAAQMLHLLSSKALQSKIPG